MHRSICFVLIGAIIAGLLFTPHVAEAQRPKYLFKIASLAPVGSIWAKRFQEMTQEIVEKSNGEIGFNIYPGGGMGDDRTMFRKIKIGQLQGGGFTMTGIGEIVQDFRVMGIPFLFNSYQEVDYVTEKLWPYFQQAFADKNLVLLGMSEVGFIYAMSTQPIATLDDLRNSKSWVPEGDPISNIFLETAGVTPIPLSIPDVLPSLQTGLIDTVYNSFYGAIVLQWFPHTKYITDIPFAYGYGAFVLDRKAFSRLPAEYATMMEATARAHFAKLLQDTRESNRSALQVLKDNGNRLVEVSPATRAELQELHIKTVNKLDNSIFSKKIYEETQKSLTEFRENKGRQ
jgi:TRAP-type C4-dicarboxylate transport system substrate-binding protein